MLHSILLSPEYMREVSSSKYPAMELSKSLNHFQTKSGRELILDKKLELRTELLKIATTSSETFKCNLMEFFEMVDVNMVSSINSDYLPTDLSEPELINLCKGCLTTNQKSILGSKVSAFKPLTSTLRTDDIFLINSDNMEMAINTEKQILSYNYPSFCNDLIEACLFLTNTKYNKRSEDEYNDYIRDLLEFRGYTVTDQNRAGNSVGSRYKTKVNMGERDLVVKQGIHDRTIIEALRLSSNDTTKINEHYKKLINDYNPLGLKNTFLVSYFVDSDSFASFTVKYENHIRGLCPTSIKTTKDIVIGSTKGVETNVEDLTGLHIFQQSLTIDSCDHCCVHILINLSN